MNSAKKQSASFPAIQAVQNPEVIPGSFRRVAVFGGIYNNHLALEAAVAKATLQNPDAIFCLGDLGGFGPFPDRVFDLLHRHKIKVMQGNYDVSVSENLNDCGCGYTDPRDNQFAQISYDYTEKNTSPRNKKWMARLPKAFRFKLGEVRVLTCHGSPRQTNEFLWESTTPDTLLEHFLTRADADLILCTHSGIKWQRRLPGNTGFVNVGVLGRPENDGRTNVWFTMLEACPVEGWKVEFVPVEYAHEQLALEMREEGIPSEFVETILSGWWTTCLEALPAKERLRGKY